MTETTTTGPAQRNEEAAASGHGSRVISALEAMWSAIQARHADVPNVVMITGGKRQHGGDRWGHYGADFWALREDESGRRRASELFIAGEAIAKGGRWVLEVLIHEASHGVAHTRGIKDCSGDGLRYHNKRFVKIAEELGMKGPAETVKTHGWAFCTLPAETAAQYAAVVDELDAASLPYLGAPAQPAEDDEDDEDEAGTGGEEEKPKKKRRAGKRFAIVCQCETPRRLQVSPKAAEDGPIICGVCGAQFEPEETEDNDEEG